MSEQTTNENQNVAIESPINVDSQAEIVTDRGDTEYMSPELITGGQARNIVTVKLTTQAGSFLVDVLKQNPLYRILNSGYQEELLNVNDEAANKDTAKLSVLVTFETLVENIVKPQLTLRDDQLYLGNTPVPGDTVDLLLEAHDLVNNRRNTAEAVQHFQGGDGQEQG